MSNIQRTRSEKAAAILREVQPAEAFHFYKEIDFPLAVSARSLQDFAEKMQTVEADSLRFHAERQDFEIWISMLGDSELATRIGAIGNAALQGEQLRSSLYATARGRVDQLTRLSMKIPR